MSLCVAQLGAQILGGELQAAAGRKGQERKICGYVQAALLDSISSPNFHSRCHRHEAGDIVLPDRHPLLSL